MTHFRYGIWILLIMLHSSMYAQIVHPQNATKRAVVDAKRAVSDMKGREALLRSREFLREDSTYYVGYLFEGAYKATHATDYFGYSNAIAPLEKAKDLLEADYGKQLGLKTSDHFQLYYAYSVQADYQEIANLLFDAYMNTERYQKAYDLCRRVASKEMVMEYYFTPYTSLTWLTNKLRAKSSNAYDFLEDNVSDNLALANSYLDTALSRNLRNSKYIGTVMPGVYQENIMSVNHYKALIYSYDFQIDSADKYYDILKEQTYYSHNNRGNYLMLKGLFRQAAIEYENEDAMSVMYGNKQLKEYIYYRSIIDIYKHDLPNAITNLKDKISKFGTIPGFGWYNIALARAYIYDGNMVQAQHAIKKAEKFKELHIGTSLGQAHYDFSLNLVKYRNAVKKLQWLKKRYSSWWWRPSVLAKVIQLSWESYTIKYLLIAQLADNPEREMVIYKIFASESVASWDEVMLLILELDEDYFLTYFEKQLKEAADRPVIQQYYRLILANLFLKKGETAVAAQYLEAIDENIAEVDMEYEKLFLTRFYESLSQYHNAIEDPLAADKYNAMMYQMYPQLAGFADYTQAFEIRWDGAVDEDVMNGLERAEIRLVDNGEDLLLPIVHLHSEMQGETKMVVISVSYDGIEMVKEQRFFTEDKEAMNYSILRALFGMAIVE